MRILFGFLLAALLAGEEPPPALILDLRTALGAESNAQIRLVPPGCWDGLLLATTLHPTQPRPRRPNEATVEVWDLAVPDATPRQEGYRFFMATLKQRLAKAMSAPPPGHGAIELAEIMSSDPSQPQNLDVTRVESLQRRYNRLPPNGSSARN